MSLPTDYDARKALPVYDFLVGYFPDAFVEVVRVAVAGNQQHNPGEHLHWAREKSTDQLNTALRHMMDHGTGNTLDTDGTYHLAKAIWRLSAELQLLVERARQAEQERDSEWIAETFSPLVHVNPRAPLHYGRAPAGGESSFPDVACDDLLPEFQPGG